MLIIRHGTYLGEALERDVALLVLDDSLVHVPSLVGVH
jgi:hypothetical protein